MLRLRKVQLWVFPSHPGMTVVLVGVSRKRPTLTQLFNSTNCLLISILFSKIMCRAGAGAGCGLDCSTNESNQIVAPLMEWFLRYIF